MRFPTATLACSLILAALPTASGLAQGARIFYLRTASDTLSAERFHRAPGRIEGELVSKLTNQRWTYVATLGPDDLVTRLENQYRLISDSVSLPPKQSADLDFRGDSAIAVIRTGLARREQRLGTKAGSIPYVNPSFVLIEQAIRRARRLGGDSVEVPLFLVGNGQTIPLIVRRRGADSVRVSIAGAIVLLSLDATGSIRGGSIPSQGLTLAVSDRDNPALFRAVKPDYSAPAGAPYTAVEVRVPGKGGHTLVGTLTLPAGAGASAPVPAVVTITGSGPEDRDEYIPLVRDYRPFRQLADSLGRRGVAVLRMDDRGTGASGGTFAGATSFDFADDARAGLEFLRTRPEIDSRRLGLIGHSEGGLIAPLVASTDPELKGIVLMAGPAFKGRPIIAYQQRYAIEHDTAFANPVKRDSAIAAGLRILDSLMINDPWMHQFLDYDPLETARRVRVPVLILQGETDRQVSADQAPLLAQAFRDGGNRDVTMRVFPATNHLFLRDPDGNPAAYTRLTTGRLPPEVVGLLVDWLVSRLAR